QIRLRQIQRLGDANSVGLARGPNLFGGHPVFVDALRLRVLLVQADAQQTQSRVQGVELRRRRRCEHRSVHDSQCGVDERGTGPPASAETATGVEQIE